MCFRLCVFCGFGWFGGWGAPGGPGDNFKLKHRFPISDWQLDFEKPTCRKVELESRSTED